LDGGSALYKASVYTRQHNTEKQGCASSRIRTQDPSVDRSETVRTLDLTAIGTGNLFNDAFSTASMIVNDEWEIMWTKVVVAYFKQHSYNLIGRQRKTMKKRAGISGVRVKTRTHDLPNM